MSGRSIRSAEGVTEGHPDKLCDVIADAIVDEYIAHDPLARVGCEVLVAKNTVMVAGEITSAYVPNVEAIVRGVLNDTGYTSPLRGICCKDCTVLTSISGQSAELSYALTGRLDDPRQSEHSSHKAGNPRGLRSGDQAVVVGYASNSHWSMIPPEAFYAKKIAAELTEQRRSGALPYLWPDGKTLVTLLYEGDTVVKVHTVVVSAHHSPEVDLETLRRDVVERVVRVAIPGHMLDEETIVLVNPPTGSFSRGGPAVDTGVTGRKTVADGYGPAIPHGGGALSGKDPTKIDRCGAYGARFIAKSLVAAGAADEVVLTVAYVIGRQEPVSVSVRSPGCEGLAELVLDRFDLTPGGIIEELRLAQPIYVRATRAGHFGLDLALPWERENASA